MIGSMMRNVIVVAVMLAAMCLLAEASGGRMPMEQTAGAIQTVLKVKVLSVTPSGTHMKLKSGAEGPVTQSHVDYKCQIVETIVGKWAGKTKTVSFRFTRSRGIVYDENGKQIMKVWGMYPGSGMEFFLKKGKEYLACFAYRLDPAKVRQQLYVAYRPEDRQKLLAAIDDGKAFAKFIKALTARLPEGWKISGGDYTTPKLFGADGGKGFYIRVYDHKSPIVAGKRAHSTDLYIGIMALDYKAKVPKGDGQSVPRQIGAWRGRRVLTMGGGKRWSDNTLDITAAFKSSGYPLRPPLIECDYKLAEKITADLGQIKDYRKRSEYTAKLLKDRKKALPALIAMLQRGEGPIHKNSSMLLWEYASIQLMSFEDPRIASHLIARLARGGDRGNSHLFVRNLAKFKIKASVPYLIRWLRRDGSWDVKYDMFGEEASYLLAALDRIAGTRFGPADQIGKREYYMGLKRSEVMPKVEKWWKANKDK